jgi:hypothetical protein
MKRWIVTLAGMALFAAAFFLPAVRSPGTSAGSGPMIGWMCALVAASATGGIFRASAATIQGKEVPGIVCLILSGWVNPLVVFYLVASIWRRLITIRRVLAAAILVCIAATWIFFFKAPMIPLIGHYLWVAGALMILAGEILRWAPAKENSECMPPQPQ